MLRELQAQHPTVQLMQGHCGETEFGDSDCQHDESGAWRVSSQLRNGTLLECMARCACCERCRYVSYSPAADDCSWYRECDRLKQGAVGRSSAGAADRGAISVLVGALEPRGGHVLGETAVLDSQ